MKRRNAHVPEGCRAVSDVLARVGDKWSVLVVTRLGAGPLRFNALKRAVEGVSQRMLTLTLRGLERDGLVTRTVYPGVPARVEYALTALGQTLRTPVDRLAEWALANIGSIDAARRRYDLAADPDDAKTSARGPHG